MKILIYVFISLFFLSCAQEEKKKPNISPQFKNPQTPPKNCIKWFDGCNTCSVDAGHIIGCSDLVCFVMLPPKCLKYKNGPSLLETRKAKCTEAGGTWQRKRNGAWICMTKTADANLPCDTSQECQGICMYYKGKTRGFCSRFTPFVGCAQEYENGKHFNVCE